MGEVSHGSCCKDTDGVVYLDFVPYFAKTQSFQKKKKLLMERNWHRFITGFCFWIVIC